MKYENCHNCRKSRFFEKSSRTAGFLGFLFGYYKDPIGDRIHCSEDNSDIDPEEYHRICNRGCGSFYDNAPIDGPDTSD